jgi:hypothetical protein
MKSISQSKGVLITGLLLLILADLSPASDLIEPTRTLQSASNVTGSLTILSEPPNLEVALDNKPMGKTPVFLDKVTSGIHTLRVHDSETTIDVKPDATLQISLFKGKFINVPVEEKKPVKQQADEQRNVDETRATRQSPKGERQKNLTPWEKYLDGTSDHF